MNLNKLEAEMASLLYDEAVQAAGHLGDDQADSLDSFLDGYIPGAVATVIAVAESELARIQHEIADRMADEPRNYPGEEDL